MQLKWKGDPLIEGEGTEVALAQGKGERFVKAHFSDDTMDAWDFDDYTNGQAFSLSGNGSCVESTLNGTLPDRWSWLQKASYKTTKRIEGRILDFWELNVTQGSNFQRVVLGVEQSNVNVPVYEERETPDSHLVNRIMSFSVNIDRDVLKRPAPCKSHRLSSLTNSDNSIQPFCKWQNWAGCAGICAACAVACCMGGCSVEPACVACLGGAFAKCSSCF